tara:strand:+ start:909 stop:1082 length:174 start_codon:yes stop_codon:yes gene_type:complete
MSKGSKQRPKFITEEEFNKNWNKIFARRKTPKHGRTLVHKDKTKVIPRREKYDRDYE